MHCKELFNFPKIIITKLENSSTSLYAIIISFLSFIILRCLIESYFPVNRFNSAPPFLIMTFLHEALSFISGMMCLLLLCYVAIRTNIVKIARVILPFYFILLIVPLVDITNYLITGYTAPFLYITTHSNQEIITLLFTYFGNFSGISLGMRVEIATGLICLFALFFTKTHKLFLSTCFTFLSYALIFTFFCMPIIIDRTLVLFYFPTMTDIAGFNRANIIAYSLIIFITGIILLNLINKKITNIIFSDLPWLRILHYTLMLFLGVAFSLDMTSASLSLHTININFILCFISIIFSALSATIVNNFADKSIDIISNRSRALSAGLISENAYKQIGIFSFLCAMCYAALAGQQALLVMLTVFTNYYLYSMPPIRFKRVTVLSKLVISINSLLLLTLGCSLTVNDVFAFPSIIFPIFLIGLTCCANFIDIKDYTGDKAAKIKTLPVVLGLPRAKLALSIAFVLTYLSFFFIVNNVFCIPFLLLMGATQCYLLNKKQYDESLVFITNNICFLVLIIFLVAKSFIGQI